MSTATADTRCHHCNTTLPEAEMAEGWCGSCGKKLPSTFKAAVKSNAPPLVVPPSSAANPWGVGLMAAGSLAISLALAYMVIVFTVQ